MAATGAAQRQGPREGSGPLLVAHDWSDARRRDPLTLAEVLDAFAAPPLEHVRFDLDLKMAGREDEIADALRERHLIERGMVSTMETESIAFLRDAAPALDRGWTLPKVSRDSSRTLGGARSSSPARRRFGPECRRSCAAARPRSAPWAVGLDHPLVTRRLVDAAHGVGVSVIAWTVDELERAQRLAAIGVDGICSNDPRLLADLGTGGRPAAVSGGSCSGIDARSTAGADSAIVREIRSMTPVGSSTSWRQVIRMTRYPRA